MLSYSGLPAGFVAGLLGYLGLPAGFVAGLLGYLGLPAGFVAGLLGSGRKVVRSWTRVHGSRFWVHGWPINN